MGEPYSAEGIADAVVHVVAKDAFVHIRDPQFRELLDWHGLSEDERAQIQIELELGSVAFAYLLLEALEEHLEHSRSKESARSVRNELISAFVRHIKRGQPDQRMREMIVQSIAQRCEECRDDFRRRRNELKTEDLKRIYWIEFCAANTLNHLLADRPPEQRDEDLYDNLAIWNMHLATNIQKSILKRAKLTRLA